MLLLHRLANGNLVVVGYIRRSFRLLSHRWCTSVPEKRAQVLLEVLQTLVGCLVDIKLNVDFLQD